ncbi:iron uptake porin [Myxacorys almedinensis]|uniref:Iron uptake porin n=1 Tax=Myxacorys almedinensis A TaxID=2690445 RepID=A0A8J8CJH1_9CYAN|nr:iron uptake porin [Myxacorys almedinensis]NDJ18993.1 iron uptake porin [Myxacorys almedinensis A]
MFTKINSWKLFLIAPIALLFAGQTNAAEIHNSASSQELHQTDAPTRRLIDATAPAEESVLQALPSNISSKRKLAQQPNATQPIAPTPHNLTNPADEVEATDDMSQVTSVSQLTDVRPTDWAFQALQSLVERYGCIAGFPDRTYRGNRATTRYEFAAGLNACLDRVNELIAASTADLVKKEDLATLQKLQEEFSVELATLRGRVDALEARTTTLEKQQFSTTTKLSGLGWFNITGAFTGDDIQYEGVPGSPAEARFAGVRTAAGTPVVGQADSAETTFSFLTWLTLTTSFTGRDSLITQLAAGNGISPYNQFASAGFFNASGVPFTDQTAGTVNGRNDVVIHDLFYSFPVGESITVTVGPRVNWYRHFDFNRFSFFLTGASSFDSIGSTQTNTIDRGSGAVIEWNISPQLRFAAGYLGENTEFLPSQFGFNTSSNPAFGLFGGTNTTTAELTFSPSSTFNLRLGYNHSRIQAYGGQVGGAIGEPLPYGYVDAGPGFSVLDPITGGVTSGGLKYAAADAFTVNFDWLISPRFGIFGRYGYATTKLNPIDETVNTQSFQVGVGFPDLGKKGALGVVTFLMPMDITRGRRFFAAGGGDGGTQYQLEASYFYPLSNNIAIVPAFYAIFNPNNFASNSTVYVGNIRTQFSF